MRFLANENFPRASVCRLREAGHDVFDVTERMPGATDTEVLAYAAADARILLTFDRDYGELIYRQKRPVPLGVVYLRIPPAFPLQAAETLLSMEKLTGLGDWGLEGQFTVINSRDIRQRPLP
jgi:predicted nuclease of predicted toxin-antitoxin system